MDSCYILSLKEAALPWRMYETSKTRSTELNLPPAVSLFWCSVWHLQLWQATACCYCNCTAVVLHLVLSFPVVSVTSLPLQQMLPEVTTLNLHFQVMGEIITHTSSCVPEVCFSGGLKDVIINLMKTHTKIVVGFYTTGHMVLLSKNCCITFVLVHHIRNQPVWKVPLQCQWVVLHCWWRSWVLWWVEPQSLQS